MDEWEWWLCDDPRPMLDVLHGRISERRLRLFAVACFRRDWTLYSDARSREAIVIAERYADGWATSTELKAASDAAMQAAREITEAAFTPFGTWRTDQEFEENHRRVSSSLAANDAAWGSAMAATARRDIRIPESAVESQAEAVLFRHIVGSPFRPYPAPLSWPSAVIQLANALYNREDCGFALHDALLEAGHSELADHFHQEPTHPKGCWILDLILGKS